MKLLNLFLASSLVAPMASALDMMITETMTCEEDLPVKMNITWLCSETSQCTFGNEGYVKGSLIYQGLKDSLNVTEYDELLVDASLKFSISGMDTYEYPMLDLSPIPVCGDRYRVDGLDEWYEYLEEQGYEYDGGETVTCPGNGKYLFDGNYTFPSPSNDFLGWAASGYNGKLVLDLYFNSTDDLVGQCTMGIQTVRTMDYNEGDKGGFGATPNGRLGLIIALAVLAALLLLCIACRCCCGATKKESAEPLMRPEEREGKNFPSSSRRNRKSRKQVTDVALS